MLNWLLIFAVYTVCGQADLAIFVILFSICCRFAKLKEAKNRNITKEYFIKVLPYTAMNIVCPSDVIMNTWRTRPPYVLTLHENLWHVDKAGYDRCEVNKEGKLLLVCNNPSKPKKLQFSFHPIYSSEEPRFAPGRHYYFISKFLMLQFICQYILCITWKRFAFNTVSLGLRNSCVLLPLFKAQVMELIAHDEKAEMTVTVFNTT